MPYSKLLCIASVILIVSLFSFSKVTGQENKETEITINCLSPDEGNIPLSNVYIEIASTEYSAPLQLWTNERGQVSIKAIINRYSGRVEAMKWGYKTDVKSFNNNDIITDHLYLNFELHKAEIVEVERTIEVTVMGKNSDGKINPISNASVQTYKGIEFTNNSGIVNIKHGIIIGEYMQIYATAERYEGKLEKIIIGQSKTGLTSNNDNVVITLEPQEIQNENFTLKVIVLSSEESNKPLANAYVELAFHTQYQGKTFWASAQTDDKGEAKIEGVPYNIEGSSPYIRVEREKYEKKWSDLNADLLKDHTVKERNFTIYLQPDKNKINLGCWSGTWYYKDPSGNGYYEHTISAGENEISSWSVKLTSTDRHDDFTYFGFLIDNDYINNLRIHGKVLGQYDDPNAVNVKKKGIRSGTMDAQFIKGNSTPDDKIYMHFYEDEKSDIHQNREWGWVYLYRNKK